MDLQDVTLRSISTPDISYLKPLQHMWSLSIKLGGITDLNAVQGMENIKHFELWQVKGLSNLEVISNLTGLQFLVLQSLPQVSALPPLNGLIKLRRIILDNMKGLSNLDSILSVPGLKEFMHINAQNMQPADYEPLMQHKTLKQILVHFGSVRKENQMQALLINNKMETSPRFKTFEYDH